MTAASLSSRPTRAVVHTSRAHPLAQESARISRTGVTLGLLGLASFVPVFVRTLESWRVSPRAASHHATILGQRLSYPVASAGAVVVLALAALGSIALAAALAAIAGELRGARRVARWLSDMRPAARDGFSVIEDPRPLAFCAGLLRPRVYVSTGALAGLDESARTALLCHERHHARRRDPLRLATARVLARALFFVPGVRQLRCGHELFTELGADDSAVTAAEGGRSALARAMLGFSAGPQAAGIDPVRVDVLLGEAPDWRFPTLLCAAALALLGLIAGVAVLVGREASGSATLAAPFLSAQPCIVMLASLPAAAASLAVLARRRARALRDAA